MQFKLFHRSAQREALPAEIYLPLVDSLYQEGRVLLIGTIFVTSSIISTYWKTGEITLLYTAFAVGMLACLRGVMMRAYFRARPNILTTEDGRRWEDRYVAGATAFFVLLGVWCYLTFTRTSDAFAHLVSFSMTIAYSMGIFGRNFANSRFVVVQILCAGVPMTAALVLYGTPFYWFYAGLLVPFFFSLKSIAARLRATLLDAVITSREMSLLAKRFDTALNNMPHGLCMFDSNRRIVVSNQKLHQQLKLPADLDLKGVGVSQFVDNAVRAGLLSERNAQNLILGLDAQLSGDKTEAFVVEMQNGRTFEFTVQSMEDGGMVVLVEDITGRKIAEARINQLAHFDPLTGLPNRTVLRHHMTRALADSRPDNMCAVHFIDLDRFKQVNDTLGHTRGDMLLKAVGERLRSALPDADVIARFGGDEFVVLQAPMNTKEEGEALAKRVQAAIAGIYDLDGHKVVASASIGIAVAEGPIGPDQFLRNADMALYRAKSEGRDTWRWFEQKMEAHAQARRNLEFDLRNALAHEAFELYYQPIFNLRTRRIESCEALLRWPHPERGMVLPGEFIPIAEEMGLIVELGNFVLRKACLECGGWPGDTAVAVNLSPIQFQRSNVPALVRGTLAATGLAASRLGIEITESTLLQDTKKTRADLRQLSELGVKISLDDFGTAYSSLSYLHSFPLHKVKIDQSFLRGLDEDKRRVTLLRGITRLSAELGLRVVVEGVETQEQFDLLAAEGTIDEVQGYFLCRPLPATDVRSLLFASYGVPPTETRSQPSGPRKIVA